jgi:hypothetical protein
LRAIKDSFEFPRRGRLSSAATHPFSRSQAAQSRAAIRRRLAAIAADLRQMALKNRRSKNELIRLARKLDAMATEENLA